MASPLHVTSGDVCGGILSRAGLGGEVLVWHDVLYDGPRAEGGWPDDAALARRAEFLADFTGGGLTRESVLATLREQYRRLAAATAGPVVLWFDACLFDQAMLAHLLNCLQERGAAAVELLVIDAWPGVDPYHGLGQLTPEQLAAAYPRRRPVSAAQYRHAAMVDAALAGQDQVRLGQLAAATAPALPWVPAAIRRWQEERPGADGLGRLERMALAAIRQGHDTPARLLAQVAAMETAPQYWGDTTLWAKVNGLAARRPPPVRIVGPAPRLPQWEGQGDLSRFRILPAAGASA